MTSITRHTLLAAAGLAAGLPAAADVQPEWLTIHQSASEYIPYDLVADDEGNTYTTFWRDQTLIGVNKCDADGVFVWEYLFDGPVGLDVPVAIAIADDQSAVYVVGRSEVGAVDNDYTILKVDAQTGGLLWSRFYDGGNNGLDIPYDIIGLPDGGVVATGGIDTPDEQRDFGTVKFDADGNFEWERRYTGVGAFLFENDEALFVFAAPDGNPVIIGQANTPANQDVVMIKYDAATGDTIWQSSYDSGTDDLPRDAKLAPNGDVVLFGGAIGDPMGLGQWYFARFDGQTGAEIWRTNVNPGLRDFSRRVCVAPNGDVFGCGTTDPDSFSNNNNDVVTVALDGATGDMLWIDQFGDDNPQDAENAADIYADADGNVYTFGWTQSDTYVPLTGDADALVLKYDAATGERLDMGLIDTSASGDIRTEAFIRLMPNAEGDVFLIGERGGTPDPNEFFIAKFDLGQAGSAGCIPADLAEPFGVLDLADVQAFIAGFTGQDPIADLAPPEGVFDLADVQAFVAAFTTCGSVPRARSTDSRR